jgi:hypothetical protein
MAGMLHERRHTRAIAEFGGLARPAPRMAALFTLLSLSAVGVPSTAGFVGELFCLWGAFHWSPALAAVGAGGMVLGAAYMLWAVLRVFFGPVERPENEKLADASARESLVLVPLVVLIFVLGLQPSLFTRSMTPSLERLNAAVAQGSAPAEGAEEAAPALAPTPAPAAKAESPWAAKAALVKPGMTRAEAEAILPPHPESLLLGGGNARRKLAIRSYWLDEEWRVTVPYESPGGAPPGPDARVAGPVRLERAKMARRSNRAPRE